MRKKLRRRVVCGIVLAIIVGSIIIVSFLVRKDSDKPYQITAVFKDMDLTEFWQEVKNGMDTAVGDYDVNMELVGAASENDMEGQIQLLHEAVLKKPDAIILAAADYSGLVAAANEVHEQGIKLIIIDSGLNSDQYDSFVATNNYNAGVKAGNLMLNLMTSKGKIIIMSYVKGAETAIERGRGATDGLRSGSNKVGIETYYCDDNIDKAYNIVEELIGKNEDIAGIICLNEKSTIGVANAINDYKLSATVPVVGFDSSNTEIRYMEKGVIKAIVIQKPFNIGYLGVEAAVRLIEGEKVDKIIDTESKLIKREEMYLPENQELLFPFMQ